MTSNIAAARVFPPLAIPAPVKTLFDDITFAHVAAAHISTATNTTVTIEDTVTQDMLDKVTALRMFTGEPEKITSLQGIGHMRNLREVILEHQFITRLPDDMRTLTKLTVLHFVNCALKSIPDWIGNFTSLTTLNLSAQLPLGAMRGSVPESIGNLTMLERFDVGNNNNLCGKLPDSFAGLTAVKHLLVQSNGFEDLTVLNAMPSTTNINARNQALGTFDLGRVEKKALFLPIRLPEVFVQAQTEGDVLYDDGVSILDSEDAYLDRNMRYVHLPIHTPGTFEVTLVTHGRLTSVSYRYTVPD